jgi:hypothetical protein
MKLRHIWFTVGLVIAAPVLSFMVTRYYVNNRPYQEPENARKCEWIGPIDPADKRACAAIPDKWLGPQFARCMTTIGYFRKCPDEVKP